MVNAATGTDPTVVADPAVAAGAAVAGLLAWADVDAGTIPLVVVGLTGPGSGAGAPRSPLLDGEVAHHVVGRVLTDNGLTAAIPVGIAADGPRLAAAARECAAAIMAAEDLAVAVLVTVSAPDPVTGEPAAEAVLLRGAPGPDGAG
jgi:hypothetical protein